MLHASKHVPLSTGVDTSFLSLAAKRPLTCQSSTSFAFGGSTSGCETPLFCCSASSFPIKPGQTPLHSYPPKTIGSHPTTPSTRAELIGAWPAASLELQNQTCQICSAKVAAPVTKRETPNFKKLYGASR